MRIFAFGDSYTQGYKVDAFFHPYTQYLNTLGFEFVQDCDNPYEKLPPIWTEWLSTLFGCEVFNYGKGGVGNDYIFQKICQVSDQFQKGDIVIINWTYLHRFLWALPNEDWADNETGDEGIPFFKFRRASINIHIDENILNDKTNLSNVYEYVGLNKSLDAWIEEILSWENIIDSLSKSVGFHVYYWSAEHRIHTILGKEFSNKKYICNDIVSNYLNTKLKEGIPHEQIPSELFHISLKQYGAKTIFEETNGEVEDDYHFGIIGNKIQSELFYDWIKKTK